MNLSCQIFIKGFTVQKIARMKNGINRYKKVRIDLGWKPKECLQSHKEFCQSLDIFGVVHVHVCAQHRRAGVSAAVNFFCASTRHQPFCASHTHAHILATPKMSRDWQNSLCDWRHSLSSIHDTIMYYFVPKIKWVKIYDFHICHIFNFGPKCESQVSPRRP